MIGIRISSAIRLHYLKHLFGQSIHVLDSMPPGYAVSTITSTSNVLQLGISEKLGVFIEYLALIIAAIIVAFTWSWELSLVTLAGILFILVAVCIILPLILKGHTRMTKVSEQQLVDASPGADGIVPPPNADPDSRPTPKPAPSPARPWPASAWSWRAVPRPGHPRSMRPLSRRPSGTTSSTLRSCPSSLVSL